MKDDKKHIAVLGSTGSIGRQTLDVIAAHPDEFTAEVLTAGSNAELLAAQAEKFRPDSIVIADESKYDYLKSRLENLDIKIYAGSEAICDVVEGSNVDVVLVALVGFAGLKPTVRAIEAGKVIALANKETLVAAGEVINSLIAQYKTPLLPVDSEHSAIFQCLAGEGSNKIEKILLTASGGPFLSLGREELEHVTPAQALRHPSWRMGDKITIDSASMMNKGFEVIEAHWLFGVPVERIEVVVHPQSIVHSAVQFADGAVKAQLGMPDMRIPIQYALSYPARMELDVPRLSLSQTGSLTFMAPDVERFPCLGLAFEAMKTGGTMPCILNAAAETANLAFLEERIGFMDMPRVISAVMQSSASVAHPTLDDILAADAEARAKAAEIIDNNTYLSINHGK